LIISGETGYIGGRYGRIAGIVELNDLQLGPPISSGNRVRVLRCGMPNAAPCPVVEIELELLCCGRRCRADDNRRENNARQQRDG